MNQNNILLLGGLGVLGYVLFQEFSKSNGRRFYKLPSGEFIPVEQAASRLPVLGYTFTAHGWIHISVLQAMQANTPGSSSNFADFIDSLPDVYTTTTDFINLLKDIFGQNSNELDGFILGNPGFDASGLA